MARAAGRWFSRMCLTARAAKDAVLASDDPEAIVATLDLAAEAAGP
ncbi:MAG: hypothetical protein ACJ8AW_01490 [Rhodopila sp.]